MSALHTHNCFMLAQACAYFLVPWDGRVTSASLLQDGGAEEQDQEEAIGEINDRDIPAAALEEACRRIAASSAAESLGVAFHCGMPGFAGPLSAAVWEEVSFSFLAACTDLLQLQTHVR